MSTQRGNVRRTRPQKHKNVTAFKNCKNDTSVKMKALNDMDVSDVCPRCKGIIEWKIKFKKYKMLTVPRKCIKCENKVIITAYHIVCIPCAKQANICAKCGKRSEEIVEPKPSEKDIEQDKHKFELYVKSLPERKRRTLVRHVAKGTVDMKDVLANADEGSCSGVQQQQGDLESFFDDLSLSGTDDSDIDDVSTS